MPVSRSAMPVLAIAALAMLAACVQHEHGPRSDWERQISYRCDRGPDLVVIYSEGKARLQGSDGGWIELPERESGSGTWYQSATHTIRGKGDEITYTVGRMVPMTCREKR